MNPSVLQELTDAASGLFFLSETDAPFTPFLLEAGEPVESGLRRLSGKDETAPVEIQEADYFFRNHTQAPEGDPEAEARAARFRNLLNLLKHQLIDLKVYRVGTVQVDAFLLGTLPDDTRGGLRTQLVET
ncbi:sugar-non-specific nuclease inhibitor NuiA-like protein [Flaviaesturariibacter flavus]|uniref:Sugar-non-specific nuclease inhibitor NuiA-like protein n=1 Tax=Flaviaesturariibacter flavus TaxID=2502780 RepID=A0A4R1BBW1_9BACT|nr:nuclease A inhibitor family protein [Flaviaesturariibacter flavus]TCJ14500.1 sugar-non-specific nuclease inhibitor NuiA-like protein [Flaviaesturariibacter flavus]